MLDLVVEEQVVVVKPRKKEADGEVEEDLRLSVQEEVVAVELALLLVEVEQVLMEQHLMVKLEMQIVLVKADLEQILYLEVMRGYRVEEVEMVVG